MCFGRCVKVVFQNGKYLEIFPPVFIVAKQELLDGITFEKGEDSICNSHGCFDIVEFNREVDIFELAYLARGVLGLAQVILHDQLELCPIFLGFELGERGHFTRERIVLVKGSHQFSLPCTIGFAGKSVMLAVEFLALELEEHHVLRFIDDR